MLGGGGAVRAPAHADELRDMIERAPGTVGDPVAATAEIQLAVLTPEGLSSTARCPTRSARSWMDSRRRCSISTGARR